MDVHKSESKGYASRHAEVQQYISKLKARNNKSLNLSKKIINISPESYKRSYIIAIPSYKRSDIIQTKTLAVLKKHNINPSRINIFVANEEEYKIYKEAIPSDLYNKIIIGELGLKNQRNFISNYYPEGVNIVQMDDDIEKIVELKQKTHSYNSKSTTLKSFNLNKIYNKTPKRNRRVKPIEHLDSFIKSAFKLCKLKSVYLWGVYPLPNPFFMTDKITTNLQFIVGPMWGMINRHKPELQLTMDEKENTQRTLQFYTLDGSVIRFNYIGIKTNYYKNKGGMQAESKDRRTEALKSVLDLHEQYPSLTRVKLSSKGRMPELHLVNLNEKVKTV